MCVNMENRTGLFSNGVIWFGVAVSVSEIEAGIQLASSSPIDSIWIPLILGHIIGGILLFFAFNIVKFSTISKSDIGLFYLPIFLIFLPTLSSILENKYSILISTVITVILAIIFICVIPKDLKPNLILNWKLLDNIFISLGAFLIFASFYFPEKIANLTIKEIVEKVKSGVFGSVFVYAVFRSFMALFEYKIEKSKLNGEDKSN